MRLRRRAATCLDAVSRVCGRLADAIDPPRPVAEPPVRPEECDVSRARHPSTGARPGTVLGVIPPRVEHARLAAVVPLRPEAEPVWVSCTLGTITATRPIGARVRVVHPQTRLVHEGTVAGLLPSDLSIVRYVLAIEEPDGRTVLDLPLSTRLEVHR